MHFENRSHLQIASDSKIYAIIIIIIIIVVVIIDVDIISIITGHYLL